MTIQLEHILQFTLICSLSVKHVLKIEINEQTLLFFINIFFKKNVLFPKFT